MQDKKKNCEQNCIINNDRIDFYLLTNKLENKIIGGNRWEK